MSSFVTVFLSEIVVVVETWCGGITGVIMKRLLVATACCVTLSGCGAKVKSFPYDE